MATIHLMTGFIGFGKTTIAKQLEEKIPAIRLTHDEFMVKLYGRGMPCDVFRSNYDRVDEMLWNMAEKIVKTGTDVIMDYGFWSHKDRAKAYERAKKLTEKVVFHSVCCSMDVAKRRVMMRSKDNSEELNITEEEFDALADKYEMWDYNDDYPVILYNESVSSYIGKRVLLHIDRPLGSKHPKYGFEYPLNYGFVPYTISGDGEELDAYLLSVDKPLKEYVGRCIGVIHRTDDNDDKLVVVPENTDLSDEEIESQTAFQEKWFKHILIRH